MALLPGFEYDIYISYRQKDNRGEHWVTEFVNALRTELEAAFKEDISIFFDENAHDGLQEYHAVDDSLREKLKCLIFIPIVSRTYCDPKSFAWQQEFRPFLAQASQDAYGLKVKLPSGNVASRMLPVCIHELEAEDVRLIETELQSSLRPIDFVFKSMGVNRPLLPADKKEENSHHTFYRDQVNKVANAVKEIIASLKTPSTASTSKRQPVEVGVKEGRPETGTSLFLKRKQILLLIILLVVLITAGYFGYLNLLTPQHDTKTLNKSIAVLPFRNIGSDIEQEYFCDGMTEAIITDLAKLSQLVVMSPSAVASYKGKNLDVRSIEQKLQVRYVVEGSVQRNGSALRVTAQLINAESGVQVWANRFDGSTQDVLALQDDISGKIVAALELKLSAGEEQKLGGRPTQNLEAYDLYLRGRFYQNQRNVGATDLAIPLLEHAAAIDPNFAAALAALGSTYSQKSFYDEPLKKEWDQKAFVAVEKALSIDPNLAEAHVAKGNLLWTPANRFPHDKAIAAYRRAIELKPSYDEAHEWLGFVYYHVGLLEEGLSECRKALQINPGSAGAQSRVGVSLLYMDRNEEALAELRKVPEGFNPQIIPTQIAIALSHLERRQEAKEILEDVSKQMPEDPFLLSTQALMLAAEGRNEEALEKIKLAMKREKTYLGHFHHAAYNLGSACALMKRNGDAVEWLRKAADGGFPCYPMYERDSNLNNLRQDAAFKALLVDLKKQWESYKAML